MATALNQQPNCSTPVLLPAPLLLLLPMLLQLPSNRHTICFSLPSEP
jgi:hypothetical protein